MPPAYVKPYVKRGKSDAADAVVNVRYLEWLDCAGLTAALALREIYRDLEAWRFGVVNGSNRKNKEQTTAALGVARRFRHPPDEGELS
jgi:hypothetical protein